MDEELDEEGHYEPFTDFPTPVLLAQAQVDYKEAKVEVVRGDDGVPLPFPPPVTSQDALSKHNFSHIDKHAAEVRSLRYFQFLLYLLIN